MKSLSARKIIKILEKNNFTLTRQKGSHVIFKHLDGIMVPVPLHAKTKPLPIGTFLAIVRQSKIPKQEWK